MKPIPHPHIQFLMSDGIGLRLANAAARRKLKRANLDSGMRASPPSLSGDVLQDIIGLGSVALLQHVRQLLRDQKLETIGLSPNGVRIRVCGAMDYVIDRVAKKVWVEPAPLTYRERLSKQRPPWHHPFSAPEESIEVLNPLFKPAWLIHFAARPGWFGYAFARHEEFQSQLFVKRNELEDALDRIAENVWLQISNDKALVALRHRLATTLTLHIGTSLIDLAMRARLQTRNASLSARHLNLVWRHQTAFKTMDLENPLLLSALTAWLMHDKFNDQLQLSDALPELRCDVLANGLRPKAWRYLAKHGVKRLLPNQLHYSPWSSLLASLRTLDAARWPPPPPRGFLRLLQDAAGRPDSYETSSDGVPGWFWQMACIEANACRGDTRSYLELFDSIPRWAWLVREFQLKPDKNQRRRGLSWLQEAAQSAELLPETDDTPTWALWVRDIHWNELPILQVVPLLSQHALCQEAVAMHNCVDSYVEECQEEACLLLSLRVRGTGRRVALVCIPRCGDTWTLGQIAGPCNKSVPSWVQRIAKQAAAKVASHHHTLLQLGQGGSSAITDATNPQQNIP